MSDGFFVLNVLYLKYEKKMTIYFSNVIMILRQREGL